MNKKVVFLYAELAPYITRCMEALAAHGVSVDVIAYPVNNEAPFEFDQTENLVRYRNRFDLTNNEILKFLVEKKPDAIICSGWIDKGYIQAIKSYSAKTVKILALDNKLEKGLKARASAFRAKALYKSCFDYAWVPGPPQAQFAKGIGFKENEIWQKFYTADFEHFAKLDCNTERKEFPKRFVYVGRYVDFKGINELFSAFCKVENKGWQLFCAGTGDLFDERPIHKNIHHLGFVQPVDLDNFVQEGGVFVLPSWKEPWGVVIHEFASAGYPIICSDRVGAGSVFLRPEENGFAFRPKSEDSLKIALEKIISTTDSRLFEMGARSKQLASLYTIDNWVDTAKEILEI